MKLIKLLGIAMVSVIAAMAMIGVSSASADTFCKSASYESSCAEGNKAAVGSTFNGELKEGKATLTGALNVECSTSTVAGEITENPGTTVKAKITGFTLKNCTNCTEITAREFGVAGKWAVSINWLGQSAVQTSEFIISGFIVEFQKCPLGIQCVTGGASVVTLDMISTGAAQTIKFVNESVSLGICGNGSLSMTIKITLPLPSWVSQNP